MCIPILATFTVSRLGSQDKFSCGIEINLQDYRIKISHENICTDVGPLPLSGKSNVYPVRNTCSNQPLEGLTRNIVVTSLV